MRILFSNISFVYLFTVFMFVLNDRCFEISNRASPTYKLLKRNGRSTKTVISRKEVANLDKCEEFAISRKALAFNYRHVTTTLNYRRRDYWNDSNCHALECPEMKNLSGLVNDKKFSYYSIFKSRILPANESIRCLPKVGVFYFSDERLNYTNAQMACKKLGGTLAHIVSEERTEGLGKLLDDVPTFVGLSNRGKERLWKNEFDEPLSCFDYRAWAPQEPSNSRGCAALVHRNHQRFPYVWMVLPCSHVSPYICEILPRFRTQRRNVKIETVNREW